jgi:hypothetical protein
MIDGIEQPGEQPGKPTANTSSPRVVDEQQSYDQQDRILTPNRTWDPQQEGENREAPHTQMEVVGLSQGVLNIQEEELTGILSNLGGVVSKETYQYQVQIKTI